MGMYDTVQCKYPLPLLRTQDLVFQTKDLGQDLGLYEIAEDGTLLRCTLDYDAARAKLRLKGAKALRGLQDLSQLAATEEKTPVAFSGELRFYSDYERGRDKLWIEYAAVFNQGKLKALHLIENRPQGTVAH